MRLGWRVLSCLLALYGVSASRLLNVKQVTRSKLNIQPVTVARLARATTDGTRRRSSITMFYNVNQRQCDAHDPI